MIEESDTMATMTGAPHRVATSGVGGNMCRPATSNERGEDVGDGDGDKDDDDDDFLRDREEELGLRGEDRLMRGEVEAGGDVGDGDVDLDETDNADDDEVLLMIVAAREAPFVLVIAHTHVRPFAPVVMTRQCMIDDFEPPSRAPPVVIAAGDDDDNDVFPMLIAMAVPAS